MGRVGGQRHGQQAVLAEHGYLVVVGPVAEQAVRTRLEAGAAIRPVPTDTLKDYRLAASGGWSADARGSWAGSAGW